MMETQQMDQSVNVFGEQLESCNENPLTGFFRDGCCNTSDQDTGSHTVCVEASQEFLEFSRRWCLCAARWLEAHQQGMAPRIYLTRTHQRALEIVPMELLREYAVDLN